jgi:chemotaxis protein methyltransferase CheR
MHKTARLHDAAFTAVPVPCRSEMSDTDFRRFADFFTELLGFDIPPTKRSLLVGRLDRRLRELGLDSYAEYWRVLTVPGSESEVQAAIDRITTNETSFFREPAHFAFLRRALLERWFPPGRTLRLWSAACSTGEEAYSLAMFLAETLGLNAPWEIIASDVSQLALQRARCGLYPLADLRGLPPHLLYRYCLRGMGEYRGQMLIDRVLRQRVSFLPLNLVQALPTELGRFEVIFLRNVLIYFEAAVRERVIRRICDRLSPGGLLLVGSAESLTAPGAGLEKLRPSIYRLRQGGAS